MGARCIYICVLRICMSRPQQVFRTHTVPVGSNISLMVRIEIRASQVDNMKSQDANIWMFPKIGGFYRQNGW